MTPLEALGSLDDELAAFCRRHGIRRMAVYGSALRDELRAGSDLDLFVEFDEARVSGLLRLAVSRHGYPSLMRLSVT